MKNSTQPDQFFFKSQTNIHCVVDVTHFNHFHAVDKAKSTAKLDEKIRKTILILREVLYKILNSLFDSLTIHFSKAFGGDRLINKVDL